MRAWRSLYPLLLGCLTVTGEPVNCVQWVSAALPGTAYLAVLWSEAHLWHWALGGLMQQGQLDVSLGVHQSYLGTASQSGLWGRASKCSLSFTCGHPALSVCCGGLNWYTTNQVCSLVWGWADGGMEILQLPLELLAAFHMHFAAFSLFHVGFSCSEWLAFKLQMEGQFECVLQTARFYPQSCLPEIWKRFLTQMCGPGEGSRANQEWAVMQWEMKLLSCIWRNSSVCHGTDKAPMVCTCVTPRYPLGAFRSKYCRRTTAQSAAWSLCM